MSPDHDAIVDRYLTAFKDGDLDTVVELTHPDCVISEPDSLPYGGEYTGKNAFREMFGTVLQTWDELEFEARRVLGDGEKYAVLGDVHFENHEAGTLDTKVVEVLELDDGQIRGLEIYYEDSAEILALLDQA
jgi:ketosteroid isomerase-like protein